MKSESSQEQHLESVSALIDGELDRDQARFMIQRLMADAKLRRGWEQAHAVRACMQREFSGRVSLVEAVSMRLEAEAAPEAPTWRMNSWLRYGMGGAVAAGVAMVALVGLGNRLDPASMEAPDAATPAFVSQSTALDRQFSRRVQPVGLGGPGADAQNGDAEQQRINRIMIRHSQLAGGSGFTSFTPILTEPAAVRVDPVNLPAATNAAANAASDAGQE